MRNLKVLATLMVIVVALLLAIEFYTTTQPGVSAYPITDEQITSAYPELYRGVFNRDASALQAFLAHEDSTVRAQAWRALANTPVDSTGWLADRVLREDKPNAWFALSMHELPGPRLRALEQAWDQRPGSREGISLVLGRQGDEASLDFMLDRLAESDSSAWEAGYALGLSRLLTRHPAGEAQQINVLRQALDRSNPDVVRRYLYGYYRGAAEPLTEVARDSLRQFWGSYGLGMEPVDQYAVKLLGEAAFHQVTVYYNGENDLEYQVQLAYELATALAGVPLNERHMLDASFLVRHANPSVRARALQSLQGRLETGDNPYGYISGELLATETEPGVWLEALELVLGVEPDRLSEFRDRFDRILEREAYYLPSALNLFRAHHNREAYLNRIEGLIQGGPRLRTMYAVQSLTSFLQDREELEPELRERLRSLTFRALETGDRGTAYALPGLFGDQRLFGTDDWSRIGDGLSAFRLPEDIEVYQSFAGLLHERYREQARPLVDSLAARDYAPLNRSLAQAGWDVSVPAGSDASFRTPGWDRLWEMGRHPVWTLETDKGTIAVQMDLLSAPATVSAIDSLTMSGAYDGVPFHRVIPNFVIQGGDIERADGFGGPDFIIPTEGSEQEFSRGSAGIASAGTDTEGSQYFFMHQWKPHLDGAYTRFGRVVEGINVVDRITMGDTVRTAGWR
ncbi:MAG: peptidylprolyl isomerase [Balneolaceae bacterium]|nr:peptidylprolyl isomerase [Balneolaceae bacterium]